MGQDFPRRYVSKTGLKREYGLTDALIMLLGGPDEVSMHRMLRNRQPVKLYLRERVEEWIMLNPALIASGGKKIFRPVSDGKRLVTRRKLAGYARNLRLRPVPDAATLERQLIEHHWQRYGKAPKYVTVKAMCSFIRHAYTNYDLILSSLSGRIGHGELYQQFKLYLCCVIIRHYELDISPTFAAFGEPRRGARAHWPSENLEDYLREKLGLNEPEAVDDQR